MLSTWWIVLFTVSLYFTFLLYGITQFSATSTASILSSNSSTWWIEQKLEYFCDCLFSLWTCWISEKIYLLIHQSSTVHKTTEERKRGSSSSYIRQPKRDYIVEKPHLSQVFVSNPHFGFPVGTTGQEMVLILPLGLKEKGNQNAWAGRKSLFLVQV